MGQTLEEMITESGFEVVGRFDAVGLEARREVRDMCASDKCHAYDKSWACPPACGSIEQFQEQFGEYSVGYVFQTIARMADEFDYETLEAASLLHGERFHSLVDKVNSAVSASGDAFAPSGAPSASAVAKPLLLSAGTCRLCPQCGYPEVPCRFPEKVYPSMEAAGLLVSDVCQLANIPYYHGPGTVAYVSCALENTSPAAFAGESGQSSESE
jgi:predicted metal-binding protein